MSAALALPTEAERVVAEWRAGVLSVGAYAPPCPGMVRTAWPEVHAAMLVFLERWGVEAVELGWSAIELFGVHTSRGAVRMDSTGLLVTVYPMSVAAITRGEIHLVNKQRTARLVGRGMTNPAESVPIWRYGKGDRP